MSCREVQDRLDDLLAGTLTAEDRRAVEEHLLECADCRELRVLMEQEPDLLAAEPPAVEPPPGLAASILARTSGAPCARAGNLLCDFVDRSLEAVETELVRLHLQTCQECAALSGALARMSEDLPTLAEVQPDERFVADVLRVTLPFRTRLARRLAVLARAWQRLLERPRIAWEGAYIGTFILVLAFGTPGSPFAGVPKRALEVATINPVEQLKAPVADLESEVASGVQSVFATTGEKVAGARQLASGLAEKSSAVLDGFKQDLGTLWERITSEQETDEDNRSPEDEDRTQGDKA